MIPAPTNGKDAKEQRWLMLCAKIRRQLTIKRLSANAASKAAGRHASAIADILSGKSKSPSLDMLDDLAQVLGLDFEELLGVRHYAPIPVIGVAEDAMHLVSSVPNEHIREPYSLEFPDAKHFALIVRYDVTKQDAPLPLLRGMIALCIDMESANITVESGKFYVLERSDGHRIGRVITLAEVRRDRTFFHSEARPNDPIVLPTPAEIRPNKNGAYFVAGRVYKGIVRYT